MPHLYNLLNLVGAARLRSVPCSLRNISKPCLSFDKISQGRAHNTTRRSQREHLPFPREPNFEKDQTAGVSVKHSRKSSHCRLGSSLSRVFYLMLSPVSATSIITTSTTRPSNHLLCIQLALNSAGASCFGTWNNRILVLDLAPPHPLPSGRIASLKIETASKGLEKDDPIPASPPYWVLHRRPPRVPTPDPARSFQLDIDKALLGTGGPSHSIVPHSSVGSQLLNTGSYPCPSFISALLAKEGWQPVESTLHLGVPSI